MKGTLFISDILILLKLYAPKLYQLEVWDPNQTVIEDTSWKVDTQQLADFKVLVYLPNTDYFYSEDSLSTFDLILDFSETNSNYLPIQLKMNYLNNPQGKMRWLFSNKNKKATFLKFYNTGTFKARLNAFAIKASFKLGLKNWVRSGTFILRSKKPLKLTQIIEEVQNKDYSLFLGSEGNNRTALAEIESNDNVSYFFKIPLTMVSKDSVVNEKRFLKMLHKQSFRTLHVPEVTDSSFKEVLITQGIETSKSKRSSMFTDVHFSAIEELVQETKEFSQLIDSTFWKGIHVDLSQLVKRDALFKPVLLAQQLKADLNAELGIYTCLSHGDFTPWNMFVTPDKLNVYDWEMAEAQMPLLFDLFHFHFQTGVLVTQISYEEIKTIIYQACAHPKVKAIIDLYGIDVAVYLKLYVLKSATKYLIDFQNQPNLNLQNEWILLTLEEALEDSCEYIGNEHRPVFIADLNTAMETFSHAYLKLLEPEVTKLSVNSDLDIVLEKEAVNTLVSFCKNHSKVGKVKVFSKSFMSTVEIFFKDEGFLAVDFIHAFKRKNIIMMDVDAVLNSARPNANGYLIPDPVLDFEYAYLFYQLNGASIPEKYQRHFADVIDGGGMEIPSHIQIKYDLTSYSKAELMSFNPKIQAQIGRKISASSLNFGFKFINHWFDYAMDTVYDITNRQGLVITFSGVDGAGKTTIIDKVKRKLETKYRKEVVLLRHRPGVLPILSAIKHGKKEAEQIASVTMPRLGNNNNVLSSLARFTYYFSDYMLGQIYVYFKYTLRGKIVLYDRYYFDFINDAKRSNIQLNRGFVKSLYRLVFKPDLNFFLYADAPTILSRKKEMVAEEIVRISSLYQKLFTEMERDYKTGVYTSIENKNLEDTLRKVLKSYQKVA
jgi:thymidylate kinase